MKNGRFFNELLCMLTVMAIVLFGCRRKEADVEPPPPLKSAEQTKQLEKKNNEQPQSMPEAEHKPLMSQMTPVEMVINATAMRKTGGMYATIEKDFRYVIIEEEADIVFPMNIGGFSLSYVGLVNNQEKRPVCICYDSEELMSSVCVLIEQIPLDTADVKMDLAACQGRMQEMVRRVSVGDAPLVNNNRPIQPKLTSYSGIKGLQFDEISQEGNLEKSSLPFRSITWTWRVANGNAAQYLVSDNGLHGAEMFWSMRRAKPQASYYYGHRIDNPAAELQYCLKSLVLQKNGCLITAIVQSEGSEASEKHTKAVEAFTASLDKDVLTTTCRGFYDRQNEKYEKSAWSTFDKKPLPIYAALRKDVSEDVLSSCLSREDMEGKSFSEICGVDYYSKLNYSKCDEQSRLADARQNLILYIKEYSMNIPESHRRHLEIVFQGPNGYVDADELVRVFGAKTTLAAGQEEGVQMMEKMLREKIMLRVRQVQRITRIMSNGRQRKLHAIEREIDAQRTARLEAYIQQFQSNSNFGNMNANDMRRQIEEALKHIIDELKSGKVSTNLTVAPQNQNYAYNASLDNALFNIAGRVGINPTSIKLDLAKTFFDLGEDLHSIRMLMSYGYNNLNNDDILSYMISNGLDVMPQNGMEALRGSSIFMDMWKSPRLSRLMILSNYQVPGYVLSNLVIEGKSDIVRELLLADAPVNERSNGQLPLAVAIQRGNTELEQLLLANGANKELTDANGKKPEDYRIYGTYWKALNSKDYKTQKECLAKGMNANLTMPNTSWRYIDTALNNKDTEAARLLLEAGADPTYNNLLFRAFQSGQIEIFRLLLKHGAPLEQQNRLHFLCAVLNPSYSSQENSIDFLKEVLARMDKAMLNEEMCSVNGQGLKMTPACYAIYFGNIGNDIGTAKLLQKLKLLEDAGADIAKMPTPQSLSPLFYTAFKGYSTIDIYSYLISKGLDVNSVRIPKSTEIFNNEWRMPSEIASKGIENTDLLTFMARHWSKTGYVNNALLTNVLPYLVEKGVKSDVKDSHGKSCLDYIDDLEKKNSYLAKQLIDKFQSLGLIDY